MQIEYHTNISENGQIPLPEQIREYLLSEPEQKIRVVIEIPQYRKKPEREYSFKKVRKLLSRVRGDMSSEIIADRDDRIKRG